MTLHDKRKELRKGCGKKFKLFYRGQFPYCNKRNLCPICKAQLKGYEQAQKEIIEKINNLKNPYPQDIFPELTKLQITQIDVLLKTHFDFPLDRLSASLMRKAREDLKEELIKSIGDGK